MHMTSGLICILLFLLVSPTLSGAEPAQVPLEDFFRNPSFDDVQISPDGHYIAAITRTEKFPAARNLVVMEAGKWDQARLVTAYKNEEIRWYDWARDGRLIFKVDRDYDDVNRGFGYVGLYTVRHDGKKGRALHEPFDNDDRRSRGALSSANRASIGTGLREDLRFLDSLPGDRDHVLVAKADSYFFPDVYRLNVSSGQMVPASKSDSVYFQWTADNQGKVRAAIGLGEARNDTAVDLVYRKDEDSAWQAVITFDERSLVQVHGFDVDNRHLWVSARVNDDRMALYRMDPETGKFGPAVAADPNYDVARPEINSPQPVGGFVSARDGTPLYFEYAADTRRKIFLNDDWQALQEAIDSALPDTYNDFVDWDERWARFVIYAWSDRDPGSYYFFDREAGSLKQLVQPQGWINPERMSDMEPVVFEARDGIKIHGYLTRPLGQTRGPMPLIVHPHGGPFGIRDIWGFNPEVQFLASRGYAVLQVNYRGSGGYGFGFEAAGFKRWGLEMQDDLTDAVTWAIEEGIADPENIGIYGASYGGYATMMGLVKTPELYRVGINYVGVVDLPRLYRYDTSIQPIGSMDDLTRYWWITHIGDPKADTDRLHDTSPINFVERIEAPVMVIHGRLDPRVDIDGQYRPLVRALKAENKTHEALVKRYEGHGFFKEQNQIELYAAMQAFLARYMPSKLNPAPSSAADAR